MNASGVFIEGNIAYITAGQSGLHILDVTIPSTPILLGIVDTPGLASNVSVAGTIAFIADNDSGVQIIDVSDCPESCTVDLNGDGSLDFFDVSAFLTSFVVGDLIADFTEDGNFDFFDVSAFLTAFGTGCP